MAACVVRRINFVPGGQDHCCPVHLHHHQQRTLRKNRCIVRAQQQQQQPQQQSEDEAEPSLPSSSSLSSSQDVNGKPLVSMTTVNPVTLGRKSRQVFDDVWQKIKDLGQFGASRPEDDPTVLIGGPSCEFTVPNAEYTTVLVAGATGRVGRILLRKLLLRGYKVRALLRNADTETVESLPRSVQIAIGDLSDASTLRKAVEGCNKIIWVAAARSMIAEDLFMVDNKGVQNLTQVFQDYCHNVIAKARAGKSSKSKQVIAKFKKPYALEQWQIRRGEPLGSPGDPRLNGYEMEMEFSGPANLERDVYRNAVFQGYVPNKIGHVDMVKELSFPSGYTLDRYEGLVLHVCGDGKTYSCLLETSGGEYDQPRRIYYARFTPRIRFSRVRLPFSIFRPLVEGDPPLDLFLVKRLAIRFEPSNQRTFYTTRGSVSFRLLLNYIKALPTGEETDFILVSCVAAGMDSENRENLLKAKKAGEWALRNSGLGYTIVRPGPLLEQPGGQRALIFDQGNRISEGISCTDVADVCVKALHDPTARNKSFDVCNEYTSAEMQGLYELVRMFSSAQSSLSLPCDPQGGSSPRQSQQLLDSSARRTEKEYLIMQESHGWVDHEDSDSKKRVSIGCGFPIPVELIVEQAMYKNFDVLEPPVVHVWISRVCFRTLLPGILRVARESAASRIRKNRFRKSDSSFIERGIDQDDSDTEAELDGHRLTVDVDPSCVNV